MQAEKSGCNSESVGVNIETQEDNDITAALNKSIKNIIKKEGYITYELNKKTVNSGGGNYLGLLYEIDVRGKTTDGDKEINIFVKKMIPIKDERIKISEFYSREFFAYRDLSKLFTELQSEACVPLTERYNMAKSYEECSLEAIILENLCKRGFKTQDRFEVISLGFAELAIQQLARFHGLSFVIANRNPEYFDKKMKILGPLIDYNDEWKTFVRNTCNISARYVKDAAREKVKNHISHIADKFTDYLKNTTSTVCCLCHGDIKNNNILTKEMNGKIIDVVLIDYQLLNYGCPLLDFFYFIYGSTDRLFRTNHLIDLKNLYYQSLDRFLNYFGIQAESVYPREIFEREFEGKLYYGLIVSLYYLPFNFVKEDGTHDFAEQDLLDLDLKVDDRIGDRVGDAVEEFIEMGYL